MDWFGFRIGENSVNPMPHISQAVRDFPTPVNKTDMRSFMALVQQISYTTAVAPQLLPFGELLKDTNTWDWTEEMDKMFREVRTILADRVEEGIRLFDPAKPTALLSDWCKHGVEHILLQQHCRCSPRPDGLPDTLCCPEGWRVCMVGSRFTHTAEANYSPTRKENYWG